MVSIHPNHVSLSSATDLFSYCSTQSRRRLNNVGEHVGVHDSIRRSDLAAPRPCDAKVFTGLGLADVSMFTFGVGFNVEQDLSVGGRNEKEVSGNI